MRVRVDKQVYTGNAKQIVRQMWQDSYDECDSKNSYMQNIAQRINVFEDHKKMSIDNYEQFLIELVQMGLVHLEEDK